MLATSDCELIRDAFLAQPMNALSSLAFLAVGLLIRRSRPVIGALAIGVAVGSFLFHGPTPAWAEWAHDVTLVALLAGLILEHQAQLLIAVVGLLGAAFALWPAVTEPLTVVVAVVAAWSVTRSLWATESRWREASAALLGSGLIIQMLSRTGGPLCDPPSLLQGHALWHLLAAGALLAFARIVTGEAAGD